ncbi:MAG: hypothetical protein ACJA1C_003414 [Crocinitomicaceae bacterium]|jgi:hypothetical protein
MKIILSLSLLFLTAVAYAQTPEEFIVEIEPFVIPNTPGIHSFSYGITSDQKWVIMGGRIDGLHQRQPFAAFLEQDNNKYVFVIDPISEQVWNSDLSVLSPALFEQFQSTNQEFKQRDTTLYIIGGYGHSATLGEHTTFPNLMAVSIDELADAVINNTSITPFFRQIVNQNLKVTGGYLDLIDDTFYLVGGQLFDGSYNPMGPNHGPGFIQQYTNEIRTFEINDDGVNLNITNYLAQNDTVNLHRRDYNMAPQIFPNGDIGFTAFSGVFNYSDMPYLNTVDVLPGSYSVNNSFNQYLSQYHCATIPIFDSTANAMHTLFFGGMSQFTLDNQNNLVEDIDIPFVKTISRVTRFSDGSMQEYDLNYIEMPTLVGSGSEFIPINEFYNSHEILRINEIPEQKTLVGYIYGGIESTAENIFFVNNGTQSSASNVIFKVFINKSIVSTEEVSLTGKNVLNIELYPVPARNKITVKFFRAQDKNVLLQIIDSAGRIVHSENLESEETGDVEMKINISDLESGAYILILHDGVNKAQKSFVKR